MPALIVVEIDQENTTSRTAAGTQGLTTAKVAATVDESSMVPGVNQRIRSARNRRPNTTPAIRAPTPVAP